MTENYFFSTEELSLAYSLLSRPELGKALMNETFGDLSPQSMEDRLTAASHSLLGRQYAYIDHNDSGALAQNIQSALLSLANFDGMIQVVINEHEPFIYNIHLGPSGFFTSHWVETGVVHKISHGKIEELPGLIAEYVTLPENTSNVFQLDIQMEKLHIDMQMFGSLPQLGFEQGLELLRDSGFSSSLSRALLEDIYRPAKRGSISYVDISSDTEDVNPNQAVAGLFFLVGKLSWLITFPKKEDNQIGSLSLSTKTIFEEKFTELLNNKSLSFAV